MDMESRITLVEHSLTLHTKVLDDHEDRLRSVERFKITFGIFVGGLSTLGAMFGGAFVQWLLSGG